MVAHARAKIERAGLADRIEMFERVLSIPMALNHHLPRGGMPRQMQKRAGVG